MILLGIQFQESSVYVFSTTVGHLCASYLPVFCFFLKGEKQYFNQIQDSETRFTENWALLDLPLPDN